MSQGERQLAKEFLDVIPLAMRVIRTEMRQIAQSDLTILQFRILAMLSGRGQATNSELAEAIGISAPGMSRLVNVLVRRGLLHQDRDTQDRRQVYLNLTPSGREKFEAIKGAATIRFQDEFNKLSEQRRDALQVGLNVLGGVFSKEGYGS